MRGRHWEMSKRELNQDLPGQRHELYQFAIWAQLLMTFKLSSNAGILRTYTGVIICLIGPTRGKANSVSGTNGYMGASGLYYGGLTEVLTKKQELSFAFFFFCY